MPRKKIIFATLLLVILALGFKHARASSSAPLKTTLDNGLTVIIGSDHSAAVVAIQMWVRVGSADENDKEAGISHVFEHMLFKGTAKRKLGEIASEVESVGGNINAYTSFDNTVYHLTVPSRHFATGLDIISDAVQNSAFDPDELKKELQVVLEELRMNEDSPGRNLYKSLLSAAYSEHPYTRPVIGYNETVESFKRAQILRFFEKWYVPNNMTLVIAGDVDAQKALESVKESFRGFKKAGDPHVPRPVDPPQDELRIEVVVQDIKEPRLGLAFHIPDIKDEDTYAIDVLADILGGGQTSRLYKKLRLEDELVHGISSYAMSLKDPGLFFITANLKAENIEKAVLGAVYEIERLAIEGPTYDELARSRLNIESGFIYSRETMQGIASKLGYYETTLGDLEYEKRYLAAIEKVTALDIKRVAGQYLNADSMTLAAVLPDVDKEYTGAEAVKRALKGAQTKLKDDFAATPETDSAVTRVTLESGITLIVKESHSNPTVAFYAAFPGGLRFESAGKNGIGKFTAAMLTRGTSKWTREELATVVEDTAGSISGFSGWNTTGVSARFLSKFFDRGVEIFADVIKNPVFPAKEIDKLKDDTLAAIARSEDYLPGYTFKLLYKQLYRRHPYGMPTVGTRKSVASLTRRKLVAHYKKFFVPGRMVLAIVGDVETAHVVKTVKALFKDFERTSKEPSVKRQEKHQKEIRTTGATKQKAQTNIGIAFLGTTIGSADSYPLAVMTEVLAGQGGRLFVELRDKLGLAYSLSAFSKVSADPGILGVFMASAPEKKDAAIAGILHELERITTSKVSEEELARAKGSLIGGYQISLQTGASQASNMASNELFGLGYDFNERYPELIEKVTAEDVLAIAKKYLTLDAYTISIVGPKDDATKTIGDEAGTQ